MLWRGQYPPHWPPVCFPSYPKKLREPGLTILSKDLKSW